MTVTVRIEKCVYGGDGLGRLGDGRVCFVPGAFAGETVRADIVEQKKSYVRASLVEVVETRGDRVEDGGCGMPNEAARSVGLVYAPVSYDAELRFKQDQLENFLWKVTHSVTPLEVVPARQALRYRNKVVYHTELQNGKWAVGYRAEPGHRVLDMPQDPLAYDAINAALPAVRAGVLALLTQGSRAVRRSAMAADNVTVRWTPIDGVKWWLGDPPQNLTLHERTDSRRFLVPGDGFYQVNPAMGELLAKAVRLAYSAGAEESPHILDLYCGVGVFGLCCLQGAPKDAQPRLVGVESGRAAVACAKRNAESMGVAAKFFCERVGASLGRIKVGAGHTVIVDPPRGGMEPNVPSWLANRAARRIFYVSCDPATLVRDLVTLAKSYDIVKTTMFDMFPRTARFETFVELRRRGGAPGGARA